MSTLIPTCLRWYEHHRKVAFITADLYLLTSGTRQSRTDIWLRNRPQKKKKKKIKLKKKSVKSLEVQLLFLFHFHWCYHFLPQFVKSHIYIYRKGSSKLYNYRYIARQGGWISLKINIKTITRWLVQASTRCTNTHKHAHNKCSNKTRNILNLLAWVTTS